MSKIPGWKKFLSLLSAADNANVLNDFLQSMLTFEEKEQLVGRILITQALLSGELSQRQIADKLKISISKITRGSNMLKELSPKLKDFLRKELIDN
jgi:TrpR family trp operon transcriptional repressor